jgi:hypothetical protein
VSDEDEYRPYHIKVLDEALADARDRVESTSGDLVAYDKKHADILQGREIIAARLRKAENDRVSVEDAFRDLGYDPKPRDTP